MPKTVSSLELVKFLARRGFEVYGRKSTHVKMVSRARQTKTIIPMHRELARGTLQSIFRQAKLTPEEIAELLGY